MKRDICLWMRPMRQVGVVAMGLTMSSCFYVWQEPIRYGPGGPGPGQQAAPAPGTLDELQAQREAGTNQETVPPTRETTKPTPPQNTTPTPAPKPPTQTTSVPTARKVPGREGFVFSPYNNKMIDVKGFPSGTKVRDPHYDEGENKFFKVP